MGTAMDATTQVHEMKHKGAEPISVEFDAFQGYPMKWHLEGPATIDPSASRFAVYSRRWLCFMLHWQGGMSRRSVDRSLEDIIKNDELIVKAYDGIRSAPTMSTIYQFIPSGSELLVALDLNTLWRDTTAKGMDGRLAMLNAFQALSTPDSAKVSALSGSDPSIVTEEAAMLARAGGAIIVVTDLDYRWSSRSGGTRYDLRFFLRDTAGWMNTDVIVIPQGEMKNSAGDRLIAALNEAKMMADNYYSQNMRFSLRVWLSGLFAVETTFWSANYTKQKMGNLDPYLTTKAIEILSNIQLGPLGRPAMVRLNLDTWEFLNLGERVSNPHDISPEWVMQLRSRFKRIVCLLSPDKHFWREIYASAERSPYYRSCYSGAFKGSGAGLQPFAVMEKHLLREKLIDTLYHDPSELQKFREIFNDALHKKQLDGARIEEILKRSEGEVDASMEADDADIDWMEAAENPAAYGKANISTLPRWQKHDPRSYGFLNPKQRKRRKAVCAGCRELLERDDAFSKVDPVSNICIRCRGIEEFENVSSHAVDGRWSPASALEVKKQYETAFGTVVHIFNLTNPKDSDFVKAMPTREKTDVLPVLKVIWSAIGSTRGIRKMLSHLGAIRVPHNTAMKEILSGGIKRYYVDMQEYTSVEAEVSTWRYRLCYDAGNVAYANWLPLAECLCVSTQGPRARQRRRVATSSKPH